MPKNEGSPDYPAIATSETARVIACAAGLQWIIQLPTGAASPSHQWRGRHF
jgi:hypothetical protein